VTVLLRALRLDLEEVAVVADLLDQDADIDAAC
jgi:hypothetical protein